MKIFSRTAVLSFGFAVAIGAAAEATPLSTDEEKDENQGLSKLKEKTSFDY